MDQGLIRILEKGYFKFKDDNFYLQNIVTSSSNFAKYLDLQKIKECFESNSRYKPFLFPGLSFRIEKLKSTLLLFKSGKINCTGSKNIFDNFEAYKQLKNKLNIIGVPFNEANEVSIRNVVFVCRLKDHRLDLKRVYNKFLEQKEIEYEPEQFPGLIFKITEYNLACLIFQSGKIVLTGVKSKKEIDIIISELTELLSH